MSEQKAPMMKLAGPLSCGCPGSPEVIPGDSWACACGRISLSWHSSGVPMIGVFEPPAADFFVGITDIEAKP